MEWMPPPIAKDLKQIAKSADQIRRKPGVADPINIKNLAELVMLLAIRLRELEENLAKK